MREAQLQRSLYARARRQGGRGGRVAVRDRRDGKTTTMSLEAFLEKAKAEVDSRPTEQTEPHEKAAARGCFAARRRPASRAGNRAEALGGGRVS
ncbi:MAG: hypothetical protein ACLVL7_07630 [Anaerotruncus massiliensis (ex Togo et al. 2019)]